MKIAVTTPLRPTPEEETAAREAAARHGLPYAPRGNRSAARVAAGAGVDGLLVLSTHRAVLAFENNPRLLSTDGEAVGSRRVGNNPRLSVEGDVAWSAGMGALRAKRVARTLAGEAPTTDRDPFVEAAELRPGDAVLDCTLGLGADALVAAVAVGPAGRVVGVEASPALAAWVAEGLRRSGLEAARRIEVRAADHAAVLAALPERAFDVVVFDPMFRHARAGPGGFGAVRRLADPRPLAAETLERARWVARRWVVVKDGAPGWDLARLGLTPLASARGAHRYYARLPPSL